MAKDPELGVASGIEFCYIDQSFALVQDSLPSKKIPTSFELTLTVLWNLEKIIENPTNGVYPLLKYLEGVESKSHKLLNLSTLMANLFEGYGKYGGRWLDEWSQEKEEDSPKSWQRILWQRIYHERSPWTTFHQNFQSPTSAKLDTTVHLFSISFLPALFFNFFTKLAKKIPVSHYLLSPCNLFWSDIRSEKEAHQLIRRAQKQNLGGLEELESLLADTNSLLANFGKVGREMAVQIENSDAEFLECFDESLGENSSLLNLIQTDLLHLRNEKITTPLSFQADDTTIEIHASPSNLRQVQVIYDKLMQIIERHAEEEDPICPSDIVVMAPDIMQFEPFIKMVFSQPESALGAQIMDLHTAKENPLTSAFIELLSLTKSRFSAEAVLHLFSLPIFMKAQKIKGEEITLFEKWIKECHITWGHSDKHRDEILKKNNPAGIFDKTSVGTFSYGLERLLTSLCFSTSSNFLKLSELPFWGKIVRLINSLKSDLEPIEEGKKLSLKKWAEIFKNLFKTYLECEDGEFLDVLEDLVNLSRKMPEVTFDFETIFSQLRSSLKAKTGVYRETQSSGVRFCSLLPMRTIPAKVIVLMGMDEEAYPRKVQRSSLDLLKGEKKADYRPSQIDFDRYLFLEALLSARKYLIFSFCNLCPQEYKELKPSLLITELMNYIDKAYTAKNHPEIIKHPYDAFDSRNFSENSPHPSYLKSQFRLAKSYYDREKKPSFKFIKDFSISLPLKKNLDSHLDIKELLGFASNPLKSYLNRTLGIYLENEEDKKIGSVEPFLLPALDLDFLKKKALNTPLNSVLQESIWQGQLPTGILKQLAIDRITEGVDKLIETLSEHKVDPKQIGEIELSKNYLAPIQFEKGKWGLPPLKINGINLVGKLSGISTEGLIVHRKLNIGDMAKVYPSFLIFQLIIKKYALPFNSQVIFAKDGKIGKVFTDDPEEYLEKYLCFYQLALENPSPLLPEWLPFYFGSQKMEEDPFSMSYNAYLKWTLRTNKGEKNLDSWKKEALELFGSAHAAWIT